MRDEALWRRIRAYGFPPEPRKRFFGRFAPEKTALAARLEREEGWEASYAEEAVWEYLRFVYLARVADRQATPSEVIDKVWHAHMTDSHDYIERFSLPLFGAPFHHEPCTGPGEMPRYEEQYAATLALYREEFRREPPENIWVHRTEAQSRSDRITSLVAAAGGIGAGLFAMLVAHVVFGQWFVAIFVGLIVAGIFFSLLSPTVPGPRHSSSSGCGGCGG